MADKYYRGGAYTLRGEGDASYDGDFEYDDSGDSYNNSNWVDSSGTGVAKPTSSDRILFTEYADKVPSNYAGGYQHVAGKRFHCCKNLDQTALDIQGIVVSKGYDGGIYKYVAKTLDATAADPKGGGLVGIPLTAHGFAAGDYVTIGGTIYYNGEYRIVSVTTDEFVIKATYIAETFEATDTAVARTPLQISVADTYDVVFESDCTAYIECSSTSQNIPNLIFNSSTGYLHISSDDNGNWDDILVTGAGSIEMADDTYCTKITVTGNAVNATVIVGKDCIGPASASVDLDCFAGNVTWDSKIGGVLCSGGTVTYCYNLSISVTADIDKLSMYGGTFNWYGKGSLKDYEQWAGTIIALGDGDKIIGSAASAYPQHGGMFDLSQAGGRVTFDNGASIDHQGGDLKPALRCNVSW